MYSLRPIPALANRDLVISSSEDDDFYDAEDDNSIAEEEEGEVIGNGKPSPPVSAGAVVINVLSSPTGREESIPPQSAPDRTNADPVS